MWTKVSLSTSLQYKHNSYRKHKRSDLITFCITLRVLYNFMAFVRMSRLVFGPIRDVEVALRTTQGLDAKKVRRNLVEQNGSCLILSLDIEEAYDTVNHKFLLPKLSHIGIRGSTLEMVQSFFSERQKPQNLLRRGTLGRSAKSGRVAPGRVTLPTALQYSHT